ncbi:MAG TPA: chemotaxis protein CheD [Steroidobacteraceae bacterium]|nr:chemotaxis protein CheD [Steroidobacteraceae bacterium]
MTAERSGDKALPRALPGFESVRRYRNAAGIAVARILPGEYYVTREDEVIDTVLGSCVAACIRDPRLSIGGMNHFMLPRPSGSGADAWEKIAGRATRYGTASMEQLINSVLSAGGARADLEVKIFGGGRVLAKLSDIGARNLDFVREFLKQEGLKIVSEDAGDTCSRHVQYFPRTGRVRVRHLTARSAELGANEQRYLDRLERAPVAGEIDLF